MARGEARARGHHGQRGEHGQVGASGTQAQAGGRAETSSIRSPGPGPPRGVRTVPWRAPSSSVTHFNLGRIQLGWLLQGLRRDEDVIEEP